MYVYEDRCIIYIYMGSPRVGGPMGNNKASLQTTWFIYKSYVLAKPPLIKIASLNQNSPMLDCLLGWYDIALEFEYQMYPDVAPRFQFWLLTPQSLHRGLHGHPAVRIDKWRKKIRSTGQGTAAETAVDHLLGTWVRCPNLAFEAKTRLISFSCG